MDRGEFRKAAELIHRANRADPANPLGWFLLGSCREQLRQFREAVGCYDVAVALRPESHLPYYRRAAALAQLKMHAEAIADYDESLRRHPDYVPAYIDRAHSKAALDDLKGAVADLDRALGFDDAPTRIFFLRAEWRQKLNDPAGAAADRREGLVRTPNDELSWVARGFARLPGDPKGALADFDAALAINPRCAPALENKASVLGEVLGRTEDATRVLDEAVAAHPDYVPARAGRAVLLARLGKRADAHADAKAALAISEEGLVLYQAACVYALTSKAHPEDRVAAFRYLRRALAAGFGQDYLATDTDLDNLRKDPEFGRIVAEAKTGT
jgi:tetratricopeptide (TPR) repeat protein